MCSNFKNNRVICKHFRPMSAYEVSQASRAQNLSLHVFVVSFLCVYFMTLWISNGAVLKSSSQWQFKEF